MFDDIKAIYKNDPAADVNKQQAEFDRCPGRGSLCATVSLVVLGTNFIMTITKRHIQGTKTVRKR